MAIPQLTPEQVRTWTPQEKDRWWLTNVFRGDMAQLTLRSAITGFLLGGFLSATNLYVGGKTGWTLGVGLTSVILAFAMFKVLSSLGAKDMTILENNAMQSIATSAGYMTSPLISGLAAYMMVKNTLIPWWQMMVFNVVLSMLGVLVAFPMKRRFINVEQQPFPEGRACGVLLDTLYTGANTSGLFKAKVLAAAAIVSGVLKFCGGEAYQTFIQARLLGMSTVHWLKEHPLDWIFTQFTLLGTPPKRLELSPTIELTMFGAGGLMNIRYAANMFVGMIAAYYIAAPLVIQAGDAVTSQGVVITPDGVFRRTEVLNSWLLWPGVVMLVSASLLAFFANPKMILTAFTGLFGRKKGPEHADPLKHIEFPLWISLVGVPIIGAAGVWMAHAWFDVRPELGAMAIPLIIVLTLIAVNSTSLTGITPTGSLSKITQLTFGVIDRHNPATNLMTACMTTEVASNAANLLMDIKPGYMLGAKPRQQAIGHCIGILSGALASTPLFYVLFLAGHKDNPFVPARPELAAQPIQDFLVTPQFGFPAAMQWKGISDLIEKGMANLPDSAKWAMLGCLIFGVIFEIVRLMTKSKSPISPVAFGLGIVLPPDSVLWMFLGSLFFWVMGKIYTARTSTLGWRLWIDTHEPICAGLIAGGALVGIGDNLVKVFLI
ncbi:MAG: OPT/YSL family transporter [Phycisphaerales bacterium]|nr:OPT/YSL family transporter [Phycisphaerales bacterium]